MTPTPTAVPSYTEPMEICPACGHRATFRPIGRSGRFRCSECFSRQARRIEHENRESQAQQERDRAQRAQAAAAARGPTYRAPATPGEQRMDQHFERMRAMFGRGEGGG